MKIHFLTLMVSAILIAGCDKTELPQSSTESQSTVSKEIAPAVLESTTSPATANTPKTAGEIDFPEFPVIPDITLPDMMGVSEVQSQVEDKLQSIINPINGVNIHPASCDGEQVTRANGMIIRSDGDTYRQVGQGSVININADGSGSSVGNGAVLRVNADGTGSITGKVGVLRVDSTNGAGSWTGKHGVIRLDGNGAGSWTGSDNGLIRINGDGSGSWTGSPVGVVRIEKDGSGSWTGSSHGIIHNHGDGSGSWTGSKLGIVKNNGDGTGEITGVGKVAMKPLSPLPPVPAAGRFPLLNTLTIPKNPCGFIISLNDQVLFDFDKSELRADATVVIDTLAGALTQVPEIQKLTISGHTDSKGTDDYNKSLSERRANTVMGALQSRQVTAPMNAVGYGESQPVAPNELNGQDNPQGRQANRRVEIFVKTS